MKAKGTWKRVGTGDLMWDVVWMSMWWRYFLPNVFPYSWYGVQWVEREGGGQKWSPRNSAYPKGPNQQWAIVVEWFMDITFELHLGDLALIKSPRRTQGCGLNAHVHTHIYVYTHMRTQSINAYCLQSHKGLLSTLCWMWPLCVCNSKGSCVLWQLLCSKATRHVFGKSCGRLQY